MLSFAHDLIGLTALRNDPAFAGIDGSGVSVAVIDGRIDGTHPSLEPNYIGGVDFVLGGNIIPALHGTHVAGIIGATDPDIGIATGVKLIGLQVFSDIPGFTPQNTDIEDALKWVLANRQQYSIVAVNMSLGGGLFTSPDRAASVPYADEIDALELAGVTIVSAAGNDYGRYPFQNSQAPGILSTLNVGAVWETNEGGPSPLGSGGSFDWTTGADRLTAFSQRPPLSVGNAIFAPGAEIRSTVPGSSVEDVGYLSGTSMAAPMVSGAVALMQQAALRFGGRLLSPVKVRELMLSSADHVLDGDDEDDGLFNFFGQVVDLPNTQALYPRLNVYNAVRAVRDLFAQLPNGTGDPNGTIQGAYLGPILVGGSVGSYLGTIRTDGGTVVVGNKDVDIFRFDVLLAGVVTIEVGRNPDSPANFDSYLRLFNPQGTQLTFDNNSGENGFSKLTASLSAGEYYVGVSGFGNVNYNPRVAGSGIAGATGNYALSFSLTNPDPNGVISGAVQSFVESKGATLDFEGTILFDYGSLVGVSDVDLFEIQVPDNGILFIDIDTPYDASISVDSFLRVFDAAGNELYFPSDNDRSFNASGWYTEFSDVRYPGLVFDDPINRQFPSGHTTDSFLALDVYRGYQLYIGVSDYANNLYDPNALAGRPAFGTGGLYKLSVSFVNNDMNGSIDQAFSRGALPLPTTGLRGNIGFDSDPQTGSPLEVGDKDVDFVAIQSPAAGILDIWVDSYSLANNFDPVDNVIVLFDAAGNPIAWDDESNGHDARMQIEIPAGVPYFAAVAGFGNNNFDPLRLGSGSPGDTGNYQLNTRLLPSSARSQLADDVSTYTGVQQILVGSTIGGVVGKDRSFVRGPEDVDLYRFVPTASGRVEVHASGVGEFVADTFLRLFRADGTEMAFNDNASNTTTDSLLAASVTVGQVYFIGVNGYSPQARNYNPLTGAGAAAGVQGDYVVSVDLQPISAHPWQNPVNRLDVNVDSFVVPLDALVVINRLNSVGAGPLPVPPTPPNVPPPYLDVNGDDYVSPIDALLIINYLNSLSQASQAASADSGVSAQAAAQSNGGDQALRIALSSIEGPTADDVVMADSSRKSAIDTAEKSTMHPMQDALFAELLKQAIDASFRSYDDSPEFNGSRMNWGGLSRWARWSIGSGRS